MPCGIAKYDVTDVYNRDCETTTTLMNCKAINLQIAELQVKYYNNLLLKMFGYSNDRSFITRISF